jgi:diacylglycerol kinase family enzyme
VEKVLLITNPSAGSVSSRKREVIAKALASDFKLETATTDSRGHAIELARDGVDRGFHAVVAEGGDGTINEVAQGLVGSDVALGILPGGTTNVMARSFGMPVDAVEATAYLAMKLRADDRRRINVGRLNSRYFLFSTGIGLDAEVVKRVENDPARQESKREWLFVKHAVAAATTTYRRTEPLVTVKVDGEEPYGSIFVVCCNGGPFTYFKRWPIDACPAVRLDLGLDVLALSKVHLTTVPRIAWGVFISRSHPRWRNNHYWHDIRGFTVEADRPLPAQVDGDHIGEIESARIELVPDALDVLA